MIMMGLEFTGKAPFHTVYLHGLVRDEQGRKMSKSLGNVLDPVDVIAEFGTDSLRYSMATGTTPGQDLNLSTDKIKANRNFTNKIWNTGKFIEFNLTGDNGDADVLARVATGASDIGERLDTLPLAERWLISSLHTLVDKVTEEQDKLNVGEVGRLLYDYFWSEYADWYIECAKDRIYSPDTSRKESTLSTLLYANVTLLKLLHPLMPFLTEELYQALPRPTAETSISLLSAAWPSTNSPRDAQAESDLAALQAIVRAIRNARAEYNVELGKKVPAFVVVTDDRLRSVLAAESTLLATLAKVEISEQATLVTGVTPEGLGGTVAAVVMPGVEVVLPMAGMFDAGKELKRLSGQRAKVEKEAASLRGRLANKAFTDKAPPQVVAENQANLAELEGKVGLIDEKMAEMKALMK